MFIDGLDVFRSDVAIWRSIMDGSGFRRMTTGDMRVYDIHTPPSTEYVPSKEDAWEGASRGRFQLRGRHAAGDDDHQRDPGREHPPDTRLDGGHQRSQIGDREWPSGLLVRDSDAEWEFTIDAPAGKPVTLTASSVDVNGIAEKTPHILRVD